MLRTCSPTRGSEGTERRARPHNERERDDRGGQRSNDMLAQKRSEEEEEKEREE